MSASPSTRRAQVRRHDETCQPGLCLTGQGVFLEQGVCLEHGVGLEEARRREAAKGRPPAPCTAVQSGLDRVQGPAVIGSAEPDATR